MPKKDNHKMNARKEMILSHAFELFGSKGFENTTIDDIAVSAGISKGGVYVHFKSKEEIYCCIAHKVAGNRQQIMAELADGSCKDRLERYIEDILEGYLLEESKKRVRFSLEFWLKSRTRQLPEGATVGEFNRDRAKLFFKDLEDLIEEGIASQEFRGDLDVGETIYIILATIDGMAMFTSLLQYDYTDKTVKVFVEMILNQVVRRY